MHRWIAIFFGHDMNLDITTRYHTIMILWFMSYEKIQHSEITVFYDSLPKSKPFQSYLKGPGKGKKSSIFALYCFMCFQSRIFQDGSTKSRAVSINCQLTHSCAPLDKTHGSSILCSSSLPVSCISLMYHIMYCIMALVSRYVSYRKRNCIVTVPQSTWDASSIQHLQQAHH